MARFVGVRHAVLGVRDPQRSITFYTESLGMELVTFLEDMQMAFLSFGTSDHDLAVVKVPDDEPVGNSGLSHTAIAIEGGTEELRELHDLLKSRGVEAEMTADHVVSKSLYCLDPDGNRLEFFTWSMGPAEAKQYLHDASVAGDVARPLDLGAAVG